MRVSREGTATTVMEDACDMNLSKPAGAVSKSSQESES